MTQTHGPQEQDADQVGAALKRSGRTLAVAESLTGSPESICEQVCARAPRLLRERLEVSRALVPPGPQWP